MVAARSDESAPEDLAEAPRRRKGWLLSGLVVVLLAAGGGIYIAHPFRASSHPDGTDNAAATSLATVAERPLAAQTQVDGTLGYDGSYRVLNYAHGTISWLPALGQVLRQGDVLYTVDGTPVILLYGRTPAYRELAAGATADAVTGRDVRQLNADLVALGYATKAQLDPTSDEFGWRTTWAIERLQKHYGLDQTGRLPQGSVVFLPRKIRVSAESVSVGAMAPPGAPVLSGTSTQRAVTVALDVSQQARVRRGDHVTVTLPDQSTTPGVVSRVGRVASTPSSDAGAGSNNTPTIDVTVRLRRPADAGTLDQAPVLVSIVTAEVKHAVVVPVDALLALAGGGYAVEVADAGSRHLVPVNLGLFDDADGLVQVTGTSLSAGQRVVVPAS